jgi:flagellar hook-associated protein 1 FlgK
LASLKATGPITQPATGSPVTIAFTAGSPATYSATVPGPPVATIATGNYVSGEKIPIDGWEITSGQPQGGDTVTIGNATDPNTATGTSATPATPAR